jgi:hypothetical protein
MTNGISTPIATRERNASDNLQRDTGMSETINLRTPKAHKKHTDGTPCGCWTGQKNATSCRYCGACYDALEVVEFAVFRCYDCDGGVNTNIMPSSSQPNIPA